MTTRDWINPPDSFKRGFDWDNLSEDDRRWVCERYQGTMAAAGQRFRNAVDAFVAVVLRMLRLRR